MRSPEEQSKREEERFSKFLGTTHIANQQSSVDYSPQRGNVQEKIEKEREERNKMAAEVIFLFLELILGERKAKII